MLSLMVYLSCFRREIPFLGKFSSKNQHYVFKMKSDTYNSGQNIWQGVKELSKAGKDQKASGPVFA